MFILVMSLYTGSRLNFRLLFSEKSLFYLDLTRVNNLKSIFELYQLAVYKVLTIQLEPTIDLIVSELLS